MHGTITDLNNEGTIVQVFVTTDDGRLVPVNFDHRMFRHMAEARGATRREDLIGQGVTVGAGGPLGETLQFDDEEVK